MTLIKDKNRLNDINAYLLIVFSFVFPLTVAVGNMVAVLIVIIWLLRGTFKNDWEELKDNKVVLAVLIFYALHIVGLLWTEDLQWGLHILKKETKFLLLPIFMLFVRREHIKYYIYGFLLAMSLSVIISYGVWFEIIPEFKNATVHNPTPFMSHISYNPFLAYAIYLLLYIILFYKGVDEKYKVFYSVIVLFMCINMFITGGRAGQVIFFVVLMTIVFQLYNKQIIKSIFVTFVIIPLVFVIAYKGSTFFNKRVNDAVYNISNYSENKNTSMGERLTYWINSYEIIQENVIIGVGTGDFKIEYKKVSEKNTPKNLNTQNPHSMYILELVQFGLVGLLSLLSIFYYQLKIAYKNKELILKYIGCTMPLLYLIMMFSDSYLLGHYTSILFVFFSSFLYKKYELDFNRIFL